ncbi:MAG: hypothetical protein H6813_03225 [Phycisphaeraceae bacterium]|nr:hypothetical protein [Phycisphaeraceae bacterium]MCB9846957.1 hypothetical protein [Phycisphaeraceae bacterium]
MPLWMQLGWRALLALLLGAVITFGVTFGIVYWAPHPPRQYWIYVTDKKLGGHLRRSRWETVIVLHQGYITGYCPTGSSIDPFRLPDIVDADPKNHKQVVSRNLPGWAQEPDQSKFLGTAVTYAYGWPFRSLRMFDGIDKQTHQTRVFESVELDLSGIGLRNHCWFPTKVLWPGAIANSAIYGSPFLLIGLPRRRVRTALRNHRDLCPRCVYDLRHDHEHGCPECGWNRDDSRANPARA